MYWNGEFIGGMNAASATGKVDTKRYIVPPVLIVEGENVLAIRVFTPTERGGVNGAPFIDVGPKRTSIADRWFAKSEFELPAMTDAARNEIPYLPWAPEIHNVSGRLYNGMIAPLMDCSLAGVVWYQGEQDTGQPRSLYLKMLNALVSDWRRRRWDELPFVLCQLPNFGAKTDSPTESAWAEIRQAQREALSLPKTALAVLIDLGEKDIHPLDKKPVGERVAATALGAFYDQKLPCSGPVLSAMERDGDRLILTFDSVFNGLIAKPLPADYQPTLLAPDREPLIRNGLGGELEGFAVCGEDRVWQWASATIDGLTVIASSPAVPRPVAVRYAWADNPTCNLVNSAGLPASPFEAALIDPRS